MRHHALQLPPRRPRQHASQWRALTTPTHATHTALSPACAGSLVTQEDKLRAKVLKGELSEADCALQIKALRAPGEFTKDPIYQVVRDWSSLYPSKMVSVARRIAAYLDAADAARRTAQQLLDANPEYSDLISHSYRSLPYNKDLSRHKCHQESLAIVQAALDALKK